MTLCATMKSMVSAAHGDLCQVVCPEEDAQSNTAAIGA